MRDWTISSIQQYRSGGLILVQAPSNTLGNGSLCSRNSRRRTSAPVRSRLASTARLSIRTIRRRRWFNAAAFTTPGQYQLGNAAHYYNDFRNPPVFDERLAIQKRMKFPVGGDRTVDVLYRADAFNLFNRTNFGGINGTIGNVNFGRPSGPQVGARLITMGVRVEF